MLIAGASVNSASACGALAFCVDVPPSYALWVAGSAFIYIMLIAGAGASSAPAVGGAFAFHAITLPSGEPWWYAGSAY